MYLKNEESFSEADYRIKMLNLIRREKFDIIMPEAMRDNNVQMWIHVIRRGSNDPLSIDFGANSGYFIFTNIDGVKIEKAILGYNLAEIADKTIYDVLGNESDISDYVAKLNPSNIAINISETHTHCDGLSYTGYFKLCKLLGSEHTKKLISSENVITDFRTRRVKSEIALAASLYETQRRIMERAYRNIIPGKTSLEEIGFYGQSELIAESFSVSEIEVKLPYVIHSDKFNSGIYSRPEYKVQKGDFIVWDWGSERTHMNFGTDFKRHAYILKDNETRIPDDLKHAWETALKTRNILKNTIKSGKTVKETLDLVIDAITKEGLVYTPYTNTEKDIEIIQYLGNSDKIGFSIDSHCVGNTGNSEVTAGPSIAPFRKDLLPLMIYPNTLISFEFMINVWIPKWNKRINLNLEDKALITERGIEGLYPLNNKIILIK